MSRRCPEEFNPWPSFVDIFASVILVMLLFLLITIVNIGYYSQFKYKTSYTASVETTIPVQPEQQTKVKSMPQECIPIIEDLKEMLKKEKDISSQDANKSMFSGEKIEENSVGFATNKEPKKIQNQKAFTKDLVLTIEFQDKEIFLNSDIKRKIKLFISDVSRSSKRAKFSIFVSDPKNMISSTLSKQVSLGRILNTKNILQRSNIDTKNINMNLQETIPTTNPYGNITIKANIP